MVMTTRVEIKCEQCPAHTRIPAFVGGNEKVNRDAAFRVGLRTHLDEIDTNRRLGRTGKE